MDRPRIFGFSYNFFYPIPIAIFMLIVRRLMDKYCFEPIGVSLGIKSNKVVYKESKSTLMNTIKNTTCLSPKYDQLLNLTKYLDITNHLIGGKAPSNNRADRFCRSCWHFVYYLVEFSHGMIILWNKPWLWNIKECWTDYPNQKLSADIFLFYVINLAYYWSLLIKLFVHKRRKDFTESVVHHVVAIFLIYISLVMQAFRIGTLVIIVLFVSDIFLEAAKILKYLKHDKKATMCFILFAIVWIVTRLGIYPFWILNHTYTYVPKAIVMTSSIYLLIILLTCIAFMNLYWTYLIFRVLWRAVKGTDFEDDRSESESEDSESEETLCKNK